MLSLIIFALLVSIFIRTVYRPQDSIPSDPAELAALREALARVEADRNNVAADRDKVVATLWKQNRDISVLVDRAVQSKTKELWREVRDKQVTINEKDRQMRLFQQSRDDDVAQQIVDSIDRSIRAEKRVEELEAELRAEKLKNCTLEGEYSALALHNSYLSRCISDWENGGIGTNSPAYLRAQVQGREMTIAELQFQNQSLEHNHICQTLQIVEIVAAKSDVHVLQVVKTLQDHLSNPLSPNVSKAIKLLIAHERHEAEIERLQKEAASIPPPPPTPPPTRSRKTGGNESEEEDDDSEEEDAGSKGSAGSKGKGRAVEEEEGSGSEEGSDSGEEGGSESSEEEDL